MPARHALGQGLSIRELWRPPSGAAAAVVRNRAGSIVPASTLLGGAVSRALYSVFRSSQPASRQSGKTAALGRMFPVVVYRSCDHPTSGRSLPDPELFLDGQAPGTVLVIDEVHRLDDPSRLLKIVADEWPGLRMLATGSSTLAAC